MSIPRPLSKEVLKKMFLKVLHEHKRPGGRYSQHGAASEGIIRYRIPDFFEIDPLSPDEIARALRVVRELEREGYIMQDPTQTSPGFKVLTDKGKKPVQQPFQDMKLPSVDIDQLLTRDDLREKVQDDYLAGDFERAIFKAFKLLEETVRSKVNQPPSVLGAKLISKAFSPKGGLLKHPDAQTEGEVQGFHHLMCGAIMWFKNPSSHRTVGYDNLEGAAQVLAFANLLLDMVEQCNPTNVNDSSK